MNRLIFSLALSLIGFQLQAQETIKQVAVFSSVDKANTGGYAEIFREVLIEKLTKSSYYQPVERDLIDQVLKESQYQQTGLVDESKIQEIGKQLGADYVCISTIISLGENYFVSAKLVDPSTSVIKLQENRESKDGKEDLLDNMRALADKLFQAGGPDAPNSPTSPGANDGLNTNFPTGTFTDPRDGQQYKTIEIAGHTWMAENLNYDLGEGALIYEEKTANREEYGLLYTHEAAEKACPAGWSLPYIEDWHKLKEMFPGYAFSNLMEGGSTGFDARLAGQVTMNQKAKYLGRLGYYWSNTPLGDKWKIYQFDGGLYKSVTWQVGRSDRAFSVRCVKN